MGEKDRLVSNMLGLLGAAVGGALGFFVFGLALQRGLYALVVPGGFLGIGCAMAARHASLARGYVCGVLGLGLGLFSEWWHRPFTQDKSLTYFLSHVQSLDGGIFTWGMLVLGTLVAYWLGRDAFFERGAGAFVRSPR
ncbi:MAG: hypothetical protein U0835_23610 [Isosphaeraceae bacterium]